MSLPQIAPGIAAAPTATRMRPPYDKLEANRIALYPMDARGLTLTSNYGLHEQYWAYDDIAKATGVQAFYARNNIAAAITRTVEADRNFYTLTYTPNPFTTDNSWHTVAIEVAGQSYTLSYRRGYYADAFDRSKQDRGTQSPSSRDRTRLLANGTASKPYTITTAPIFFEAWVLPDTTPPSAAALAPDGRLTPPKHLERLSVSYLIPASALLIHEVNGKSQAVVGAAAFIVNREGRILTRRTDQFSITVNAGGLAHNPNALLHVEQKIDAAPGDNYLYLAVWDTYTHHQGRIQVPLKITSNAQSKQPPNSICLKSGRTPLGH